MCLLSTESAPSDTVSTPNAPMPVSPSFVLSHLDEFSSLCPSTVIGAFTFELYGDGNHSERETDHMNSFGISKRVRGV